MKRMPSRCNSPRRPPWWPENEAWEPGGPRHPGSWRGNRARFFRRIGGLIALLFLVACTGFTLLTWIAADVLGLVSLSPRELALVVPFAGLVFVAAVFGAFRIGYALRRTVLPMGDLIEAANRVADGDYSARVVERGPGEMSSVAHTFNSMVERLQTNDEIRRRLLADVTHELRTPLTVIQGNLEGLLDGVYPIDESRLNSILDETRVMSRLINDLRTLSLVESGALQLQREPVNLEEIARSAAAAYFSCRPLAPAWRSG